MYVILEMIHNTILGGFERFIISSRQIRIENVVTYQKFAKQYESILVDEFFVY